MMSKDVSQFIQDNPTDKWALIQSILLFLDVDDTYPSLPSLLVGAAYAFDNGESYQICVARHGAEVIANSKLYEYMSVILNAHDDDPNCDVEALIRDRLIADGVIDG